MFFRRLGIKDSLSSALSLISAEGVEEDALDEEFTEVLVLLFDSTLTL